MSIEGALAMGRERAEARMTDTCRVGVEARSGVLDETTGEYPMTFTVLYEGVCEFKAGIRLGADTNATSQLLFTQNAVLKLPIATSVTVVKDNIVIIDSSQTDPALVGTRARVTGPFAETFATCRRIPVEVVSG